MGLFNIKQAHSQSKLDKYLTALDTCTNDSLCGQFCHKIAQQYYAKDNAKSEEYAKKAYDFYRKTTYVRGQGLSFQLQGFINMNTGEPEKGYKNFMIALGILEDLKGVKNSQSAAVCCSGASYCLEMQGKLDEALKIVIKSLKIIEDNGVGDKQKAKHLVDLGRIYRANRQFDKSIETYKEALLLSNKAKDHPTAGILHMNLGNVMIEKEDYGSALVYFNNSLKEMELGSSKERISLLWRNIGFTHFRLRNKAELLEATKKAEKNLIEKNDVMGRMDITILHGFYAQLIKDHEKAIDLLEKALKMAKESNIVEKISSISDALKESYNALGQKDKVNEVLETSLYLKDSIYNEELANSMAEMEVKYESVKKQKELEISILENKLQEKQLDSEKSKSLKLKLLLLISSILALLSFWLFRNSLKSKLLLTEKNKELDINLKQNSLLLKEIHHRVKNNLQTVSSLLNLQTRASNNDVVKEAILDGQGRLKSISLLHQKLYQQDTLERIDMGEYIEDMGEYILKNFNYKNKKIDLVIEDINISLDLDTAMPIGLIINELMTNSIKHSFTHIETGKIEIDLIELSENNYELIVSDNGPGLPTNIEIDKLSSMGLKLVNSLSRQIHGTFHTMVDTKAHFIVRFSESTSYDQS